MPELPETAFEDTAAGSLLRCRVQPGASRSGVSGAYGGEVKIVLQAPPVDGRANQALCRLIAGWCGIAKGRVDVKSGAASRSKVVSVGGISAAELKAILSKQ